MNGNSNSKIKYSFIVPVYNRLDLVKPCLESLLRTIPDIEHEILVIDDESTDGAREYVAGLTFPFRPILNQKNLGYSASNNKAAKMAKGEVLVLINADLDFRRNGWLEPMLECLELHHDAGFVGNIQYDATTNRVNHTGIWFDSHGRPFHKVSLIGLQPFNVETAVTGACVCIRKETFLDHAGFDEKYRNGLEDIDMCLRLSKQGFKNYLARDSIVWHHVSASPGRHDQDIQNSLIFLEKWGYQKMIIEGGGSINTLLASYSDIIYCFCSRDFRRKSMRPSNPIRRFVSKNMKFIDRVLPPAQRPIDEFKQYCDIHDASDVFSQMLDNRLFDSAYYLANCPNACHSKLNAFHHYLKYGWREGYNPSASFNVATYLKKNPHVAHAGIEPLTHYFIHDLQGLRNLEVIKC